MSGDRTRICAASDITIASKAEQGTAAIASSIVLADIYLKVRTLSKNGLAARSCAQAQLRQAAAGYDEESIPPRATPSARARRSAPGRHSPSAACAAKRAHTSRATTADTDTLYDITRMHDLTPPPYRMRQRAERSSLARPLMATRAATTVSAGGTVVALSRALLTTKV